MMAPNSGTLERGVANMMKNNTIATIGENTSLEEVERGMPETEKDLSSSSTRSPEPTPQPTPEPTPEPVRSTTQYILNTNTKKFHYPSCRSVKQMKESNKQSYNGTRDEVIAMGYSPCGNCHP